MEITDNATKGTYSNSHKKYYQQHKSEILERCKASGLYERKYKSNYERNKESIKAKNLARYYQKKALKAQTPGSAEPSDQDTPA